MPDLDQQLRRFAAALLDDVDPVTVEDVVGRGRRRRPGLVVVAVGVAAAVALVAAVIVVRRDDTQELNLVGPGGTRSWVALLAAVPDTPGARSSEVRVLDAERARLIAGRPPLGPDASDAAVAAELRILGTPGSYSEVLGNAPSDVRAEIGFDVREVDQAVGWGAPPGRVTVVRGRIDRDTVQSAVEADPYWSSMLEEREYEGVPFWSWGEDYGLNTVFSPLRGPGQSARLALVDELAVWTHGDPELEATLDTVAGRSPSLADDPDYRAAAELADRLALVSATIRPRSQLLGTQRLPEGSGPEEVPDSALPLVLLHGHTMVDGTHMSFAALVYASQEDAEAALPHVERFEAEVRAENEASAAAGGEEVTPVDPEFAVEGRVLVVTDGGYLFVL